MLGRQITLSEENESTKEKTVKKKVINLYIVHLINMV